MTIKRWDAKRDLAEKPIVERFKELGCKVTRLDKPLDLLVGVKMGVWRIWVLCEVKTGDGDYTKAQIEFMDEHEGWPIFTLRTTKDVDDMLSFYGVTQ